MQRAIGPGLFLGALALAPSWSLHAAPAAPVPAASSSSDPSASPPDADPYAEEQPSAAVDSSAAPGSTAAAPAADELELAKRLFLQGNEMRKAGDYERALDYYLKSRAAVRSVPNTINAAFCLDQLGRYDEALELYEELLTQLRNELSAEDREAILPETAKLRARVGSIDVVANVPGSLVVDGRPRAQLPLVSPLRVLPGKHVVLVLHEGYRGFESTLDVAVGETTRLQARLEPLAAAGTLRIDDPALAGAAVFVDGAAVGVVPWEGALEAGPHYYFVRRGEEGSAPRPIIVVRGQTALAKTALEPLGPELRIIAVPPTAEITLGDVSLGKGRWQGRLPLGSYELLAREEGYLDRLQQLDVAATTRGNIELRLPVDEAHPRWGTNEAGRFFVDLFGGLGIVPSFGSGAEQSCGSSSAAGTTECSDDSAALGLLVGGRAGYEFPIGLAIELEGGYLWARKSLARSTTGVMSVEDARPLRYDLADVLRLSGPFAAAGLGYRLPFAELFELRAHLLVGAFFAGARDELDVTMTAGGRTVTARVTETDGLAEAASASLLLLPELHLGLRLGDIGASVGLAAVVSTITGPTYAHGYVLPANPSACTDGSVECAAGRAVVADEEAYGPFVVFVPGLALSYLF